MRKILTILLAAVMVLAMSASVFAAVTADSGKGGSASITITLPTDNAGTNEEITYTVYKVFDATSNGTSSAIAYTIDATNGELSAAMTAAGFAVDSAGNVTFDGTMVGTGDPTDAAIAAVAAYAKDKIGEYTAKPSDGTLQITGLEYGYYYITTTTGTLVTIDSTNPNATVEDKNTIPKKPDKKITGVTDGSMDAAGKNAIAQVGTKVEFTATITKVKGATNYVFHDTMSAGLKYNDDVTVTPTGAVYDDTVSDTDTITLTFDNAWLAGLDDNTTITIKYSATVTSDALTVDAANNTASLDYGDGHTTDTDTVKVYNAKFTVSKEDGEGEPLAGAGFVIMNAERKFYKLAEDKKSISWVDSIDDATEYTSNAQGAVTAFTGLADGTYTLVEKTVPDGYNKAADRPFTVEGNDYTAGNLEQTAIVTNNPGVELPATGGIGTTIFYILGSLLVIGCGIVLVSRRRMGNNK